jgi:hypothetical protein
MLRRIRSKLPRPLHDLPLKIDVARHYHRPSARRPSGGQNFLVDPASGQTTELHDDELFRALPISFIIFRIYSQGHEHDSELIRALNAVVGDAGDAKTNM